MKNKKMGAIVPLLLLAVLAVGMFGGAMALWWERLNVDVTVNTGTLDAQLSVEGSGDNEIQFAQEAGEMNASVKDVSNITCTLAEDGNSIDIIVQNAYPGITYYCNINLENTGTIPFKVYGTPELTGNITSVMTSDSGLANGTIYDGLQMHPGDVVYDTLLITLTNDAMENSVYTGHMNITVEQWNEYGVVPPS
ncbi:MAG: hypothetical protein F7B59_00500 [Desulfurococcales archaeon]|nr:hypothetical protein [Desulfurococcales archaeon]